MLQSLWEVPQWSPNRLRIRFHPKNMSAKSSVFKTKSQLQIALGMKWMTCLKRKHMLNLLKTFPWRPICCKSWWCSAATASSQISKIGEFGYHQFEEQMIRRLHNAVKDIEISFNTLIYIPENGYRLLLMCLNTTFSLRRQRHSKQMLMLINL